MNDKKYHPVIVMIGEHEYNMISIFKNNLTYCNQIFDSKVDKKKEKEIKFNYSTITWQNKYLFVIGGTDKTEKYFNQNYFLEANFD